MANTDELIIVQRIDDQNVSAALIKQTAMLESMGKSLDAMTSKMNTMMARTNSSMRSATVSTDKLGDALTRANRMVGDMSMSLRKASMSLSTGYDWLDKLGSKLDAASMTGWKFTMAMIPLQRAMFQFAAITAVTGGAIYKFAKNAMEVEMTTSVFQKMTGSASLAKKQVEELRDISLKIKGTFQDVAQAGKLLSVEGFDPKVLLMPLADMTAGIDQAGIDISSASRAFTDAMVGDMRRMKNTFHITKAEIASYAKEAIDSTGQITNKVQWQAAIIDAITKKYGGMNAALMETVGGKLTNLQDKFVKFMQEGGQAYLDFFKWGIEYSSKLLDKLTNLSKSPFWKIFTVTSEVVAFVGVLGTVATALAAVAVQWMALFAMIGAYKRVKSETIESSLLLKKLQNDLTVEKAKDTRATELQTRALIAQHKAEMDLVSAMRIGDAEAIQSARARALAAQQLSNQFELHQTMPMLLIKREQLAMDKERLLYEKSQLPAESEDIDIKQKEIESITAQIEAINKQELIYNQSIADTLKLIDAKEVEIVRLLDSEIAARVARNAELRAGYASGIAESEGTLRERVQGAPEHIPLPNRNQTGQDSRISDINEAQIAANNQRALIRRRVLQRQGLIGDRILNIDDAQRSANLEKYIRENKNQFRLTAKQYADNVGLSESHIRRLAGQGMISGAYKVGGKWSLPFDSSAASGVFRRSPRSNMIEDIMGGIISNASSIDYVDEERLNRGRNRSSNIAAGRAAVIDSAHSAALIENRQREIISAKQLARETLNSADAQSKLSKVLDGTKSIASSVGGTLGKIFNNWAVQTIAISALMYGIDWWMNKDARALDKLKESADSAAEKVEKLAEKFDIFSQSDLNYSKSLEDTETILSKIRESVGKFDSTKTFGKALSEQGILGKENQEKFILNIFKSMHGSTWTQMANSWWKTLNNPYTGQSPEKLKQRLGINPNEELNSPADLSRILTTLNESQRQIFADMLLSSSGNTNSWATLLEEGIAKKRILQSEKMEGKIQPYEKASQDIVKMMNKNKDYQNLLGITNDQLEDMNNKMNQGLDVQDELGTIISKNADQIQEIDNTYKDLLQNVDRYAYLEDGLSKLADDRNKQLKNTNDQYDKLVALQDVAEKIGSKEADAIQVKVKQYDKQRQVIERINDLMVESAKNAKAEQVTGLITAAGGSYLSANSGRLSQMVSYANAQIESAKALEALANSLSDEKMLKEAANLMKDAAKTTQDAMELQRQAAEKQLHYFDELWDSYQKVDKSRAASQARHDYNISQFRGNQGIIDNTYRNTLGIQWGQFLNLPISEMSKMVLNALNSPNKPAATSRYGEIPSGGGFIYNKPAFLSSTLGLDYSARNGFDPNFMRSMAYNSSLFSGGMGAYGNNEEGSKRQLNIDFGIAQQAIENQLNNPATRDALLARIKPFLGGQGYLLPEGVQQTQLDYQTQSRINDYNILGEEKAKQVENLEFEIKQNEAMIEQLSQMKVAYQDIETHTQRLISLNRVNADKQHEILRIYNQEEDSGNATADSVAIETKYREQVIKLISDEGRRKVDALTAQKELVEVLRGTSDESGAIAQQAANLNEIYQQRLGIYSSEEDKRKALVESLKVEHDNMQRILDLSESYSDTIKSLYDLRMLQTDATQGLMVTAKDVADSVDDVLWNISKMMEGLDPSSKEYMDLLKKRIDVLTNYIKMQSTKVVDYTLKIVGAPNEIISKIMSPAYLKQKFGYLGKFFFSGNVPGKEILRMGEDLQARTFGASTNSVNSNPYVKDLRNSIGLLKNNGGLPSNTGSFSSSNGNGSWNINISINDFEKLDQRLKPIVNENMNNLVKDIASNF